MIQYLMLSAAEPMAYRSREGSAVKLRFDHPEGPVFGHIHQATEDDLLEWQGKVGQDFAVRIRTVGIEPGRHYKEARIVNGLRRSVTRDPRNDP